MTRMLKERFMKKLLIYLTILFSCGAHAMESTGYVKNLIDDDEGVKVIYSADAGKVTTKNVKTKYILNTHPQFQKIKEYLLKSKFLNSPVVFTKDLFQTLKSKQVGK